MSGKHGIENLKALANLGFEAMNVLPILKQSSGLVPKVMALTNLVDELVAVSDVHIDKLSQEILDIQPDEKVKLIELARNKIDLEDDFLEDCLEKAIGLGFEFVSLITQGYDIIEQFREKK